ncbi:acetyltransferase [Ulvibacter antarcticus]|uniref:Acetyltransferase EpsM n=1 Tax=Ulvibacter antarcticus TaxID=442714 RepID=A0A3L9YIB3_9FLAO|nr:acetyltransferase [Ulvibacter antarcticus]RMA58959.1 acetyltransferase EpsM [Ulvibacter antarcticus]
MKEITLYGAGGHAFAAVELIRSLGAFKPVQILDDAPSVASILNVDVKNSQGVSIASIENICITIGNNLIRKTIASKLKANFPSFMHKSAVLYPSVTLGEGVMVHPNVTLDADVRVGDFCIINNNASIAHNVIVGSFSHVAIQTAIAGGVTIGEGAFIAAGSVVLPNIKIGKWATVGAGAVVTKDVPDHAVVFGSPARIVRFNNKL